MFSSTRVEVTQIREPAEIEQHSLAARRVLDAVADGVLIVAYDGAVLDMNLAAERLFGVAREQAANRPVASLMPGLGSPRSMEKLFERSVASGGLDAEVPNGDSGEFPVHVMISQSLEHSPKQYVLVVRDFRPIRWAQKRKLETERLAAIGETMAALAHESRNALQRMQSCLTLLKVRTGDEVHDLVDDLQEAQDQLQRLYEEVRSFAAPFQLRLQWTDVRQLLDKTWRQLRMQWAPKELAWSLAPERDGPKRKIRADAARLGQVFRNVLENAIQASPIGGRIAALVTEDDAGRVPVVRVTIEDEGAGIPATSAERIFDLLYTTKVDGTGMGLAIARRIVREHDGEIVVEKSELGGARIALTLPRESRLAADDDG